MNKKMITQKDIQKDTGAPGYIVQYLKSCFKLPIAKDSIGKGYPVYYKPEAIDIVITHLRSRKQSK